MKPTLQNLKTKHLRMKAPELIGPLPEEIDASCSIRASVAWHYKRKPGRQYCRLTGVCSYFLCDTRKGFDRIYDGRNMPFFIDLAKRYPKLKKGK